MKKFILYSALGMLFFSCTPLRQFRVPPRTREGTAADTFSKQEEEFQNILDRAVNAHRLTGVQCSIKCPGGKTWNGASGTADLDRRESMTPNHIIRIGSLTKTYTAVVRISPLTPERITDIPIRITCFWESLLNAQPANPCNPSTATKYSFRFHSSTPTFCPGIRRRRNPSLAMTGR